MGARKRLSRGRSDDLRICVMALLEEVVVLFHSVLSARSSQPHGVQGSLDDGRSTIRGDTFFWRKEVRDSSRRAPTHDLFRPGSTACGIFSPFQRFSTKGQSSGVFSPIASPLWCPMMPWLLVLGILVLRLERRHVLVDFPDYRGGVASFDCRHGDSCLHESVGCAVSRRACKHRIQGRVTLGTWVLKMGT